MKKMFAPHRTQQEIAMTRPTFNWSDPFHLTDRLMATGTHYIHALVLDRAQPGLSAFGARS